jgi:Tol biopolymer transport system component
LDRHDSVQLTNSPSAETSPAWSPNGRLIAYRSTRDGGGLFVATTEGSEERRISPFGDHPQWSPDGSQLLFTWRVGEGTGALAVYVVGLDGAAPHLVRPDVLDDVGVVAAAWHPTGLVSVLGAQDGAPVMLLASLTGGAPFYTLTSQAFRDRVEALGLRLGRYVWSPSGDQLYFEGSNGVENLWRVTIDPARFDVVAGPDRLTVSAGVDRHLALSPDGNRLIFDIRSSRTQLWSFGFDAARGVLTSTGRRVTSGVPGELNADATSDGRKFVYRATRGDLQEVWEHSLASGVDRLLFKGVGGNFSQPRWSPDGRTLAFSRQQPIDTGPASSRELVLLTSVDSRVRTYPLGHQVVFRPTDWFADAQTILGTCRPNPGQLSAICLTTTPEGASSSADVRVIASDPDRELFNPRLSPDQRWILFQALDRRPPGTSTLFVMAASGGPWLPITDARVFADKPHWSPDGQIVLFVSDRSGWLNVWAQPFDRRAGKPSDPAFQVTSFDSERQMISSNLSDMDLAITRNQLLLPIAESTGQLWTLGHLNK